MNQHINILIVTNFKGKFWKSKWLFYFCYKSFNNLCVS